MPPNAAINFREATFLERYKWRIIGVLSLVVLQAILITFLLVERRRRHLAMMALDERLRFESMLAELSTELSRLQANEIDAGIARWIDRFGKFFDLKDGAFIGDEASRALVYSRKDSTRLESADLKMRLRVIAEIFSVSLTRKEQENELRTSEERFETAFRSNPQPMWLATMSEGRYIDVNDSFLEISGFTREEIVGRTCTELHFWPTPEARNDFMDRIRTEGRLRDFEMKFRTRRGTFRDFLASAELLELDDQQCILATASDITERKVLQDDLMHLTGRLLRLQDEERRRIARELHDETAQNLFGVSINLAKLERSSDWNPEQTRILEDCKMLSDLSIRGIRTLSYLLHPPLLDEAGLASAVRWYADGFIKRSEIHVELFLEEIGRLDSALETALFRIVQEGLTNIHRHSGAANASISPGNPRRSGHAGDSGRWSRPELEHIARIRGRDSRPGRGNPRHAPTHAATGRDAGCRVVGCEHCRYGDGSDSGTSGYSDRGAMTPIVKQQKT